MFRDWYKLKTTEAAKNCRFGAAALIPATIIAATITWWVILVVMYLGPVMLFPLSHSTVSACCWIILGLTFAWQFFLGQGHSEEYNFSGKPLSATEMAAVQFTGESWAIFLFDPKAGRAFVTFLAAWFVTAPKLASLAIVLHERAKRLNADQVEKFMPAMKVLLMSKSAVPVEELAAQSKIAEPVEMVRTLTAIDGVVMLTEGGFSMTVAPRLAHEFETWSANNS
jgi:hypothetical protein